MHGTGPRRENHNRPGNTAAIEAATLALEGREPKAVIQARKRQIELDEHQPRRRKGRAAIQDKRDSLEQEGQVQPAKVMPMGRLNRYGEPMYRLIDGELRWHGTPEMDGFLDVVVETRALSDKEIFTQQVVSNTSESFKPAELCSVAWRYHRQFGERYKDIATGVLRKYANGDEEWVGQRVRLWDKLSPNEFGEPQSPEGQALDDLLMDYDDVFTHAHLIVSAPKEKWRTAIKMVRENANVPALRAYLFPEKVNPKPAKELVQPRSGGGGITIHRSNVPGAAATPASPAQQEGPAPHPKPTQEEIEALDWKFGDEPIVTAQELDNRFNQLQTVLDGIKTRAPLVKALPDHSATASLAFRKRARGLAQELAEIAALFID